MYDDGMMDAYEEAMNLADAFRAEKDLLRNALKSVSRYVGAALQGRASMASVAPHIDRVAREALEATDDS